MASSMGGRSQRPCVSIDIVTKKPMKFVSKNGYSFAVITGDDDDPSVKKRYSHRVVLYTKDNIFTCDDGKSFKAMDDPKNASFLKSLEERRCPDEFEGDGRHHIWVITKEKYSKEIEKMEFHPKTLFFHKDARNAEIF